MCFWGTIPEWITAAVACVSLKYLIDYAKSARRQVEAVSRPVIIFHDTGREVIFKNNGDGVALNVKWTNEGKNFTLAGFPIDDSAKLCSIEEMIARKTKEVSYSSLSGQRWRSVAHWVRDETKLGHIELEIIEEQQRSCQRQKKPERSATQ